METHEDNGKCGMAASLFQLLQEKRSAEFFTRMAVASHGGERDCGHTGNYFNLLWSLPAIGLAGPDATGAWMSEFGGWYHDLARRWDGTFAHQGRLNLTTTATKAGMRRELIYWGTHFRERRLSLQGNCHRCCSH
jgi:hypothetical protein